MRSKDKKGINSNWDKDKMDQTKKAPIEIKLSDSDNEHSKSQNLNSQNVSKSVKCVGMQTFFPASSFHLGGGHWEYKTASLPIGATVKARIFEGADPEMQEHYKAVVVKEWPNPSQDQEHNGLIRIKYTGTDGQKIAKLHEKRSKEMPDFFSVRPNDVAQCRVHVRPSMIADGYLDPGSVVSARYIFRGERVKGWDGYYPCTVIEHCVDGTILLQYIHEDPIHEEYVKCRDIQIPVAANFKSAST